MILALLWLMTTAAALPQEEIETICADMALNVLPVQRPAAIADCVALGMGECNRIERALNQTCIDTSHSDRAIQFDLSRGSSSSCEAGLMKRNTQREFCDSLKKECRETKVPMGTGGSYASCTFFRDEENRKLCLELDRHATRITEAYKNEKKKCAPKE